MAAQSIQRVTHISESIRGGSSALEVSATGGAVGPGSGEVSSPELSDEQVLYLHGVTATHVSRTSAR